MNTTDTIITAGTSAGTRTAGGAHSLLHGCRALAVAAAALFAASATFAAGMSHAEYSAAKDRIGAEYKTDKAACDRLDGNAKDVCVEKAKGKEKVARAELEFNYSGKSSDSDKIPVARADADYAVAKEMCDDHKGNDKDVCVKEAKAAHEKALADAKAARKVGEARRDAAQDKRDADYKVATEKCDALRGDAKDNCIKDAKARYGKS